MWQQEAIDDNNGRDEDGSFSEVLEHWFLLDVDEPNREDSMGLQPEENWVDITFDDGWPLDADDSAKLVVFAQWRTFVYS